MDRNKEAMKAYTNKLVALHPEGVDRNQIALYLFYRVFRVALHPEGVDRNLLTLILYSNSYMSPSTRRAWIEIKICHAILKPSDVALHPEGVDRNSAHVVGNFYEFLVALHPEGVDRNSFSSANTRTTAVALHPEGVDRNEAA